MLGFKTIKRERKEILKNERKKKTKIKKKKKKKKDRGASIFYAWLGMAQIISTS